MYQNLLIIGEIYHPILANQYYQAKKNRYLCTQIILSHRNHDYKYCIRNFW